MILTGLISIYAMTLYLRRTDSTFKRTLQDKSLESFVIIGSVISAHGQEQTQKKKDTQTSPASQFPKNDPNSFSQLNDCKTRYLAVHGC